MNGNLSCAVCGCDKPVIGQCMGYNGPCGRFYCQEHSNGRFCLSCADLENEDDVERIYTAKAEEVDDNMRTAIIALAVTFGTCIIISLSICFLRVWGLLIGGILASVVIIRVYKQVKSDKQKKIEKADIEFPRFSEFFIAYKKRQRMQTRRIIAAVAVAALLSQNTNNSR